MSETSSAAALRSGKSLVVIEAPAGCGKTYQAVNYAVDVSASVRPGRVLLLAHTHAACDVFARRITKGSANVEVRTIDSLITEIAAAYHSTLGIGPNPAAWAFSRSDGFEILAEKVAQLMNSSHSVTDALANRYPILICDEHQDTTREQHRVVESLHSAGCRLRIFGDPMQRIYKASRKRTGPQDHSWSELLSRADGLEQLDQPRRWEENPELGKWILAARQYLQEGQPININCVPSGVNILSLEHSRPNRRSFRMCGADRKRLERAVGSDRRVLYLATQNDSVRALHSFFFRRIGIWEGYGRDHLSLLSNTLCEANGDALKVAAALIEFLSNVTTGFSRSEYGDRLLEEVATNCSKERSGKPAHIQALARLISKDPDHTGVANALRHLEALARRGGVFESVKIDLRQEFWDAMRLRDFDDPQSGISALLKRRAYIRPMPPDRCISTVHRAKGLEWDHVVVVPCGAEDFSDTEAKRNLLYVAISRATRSLTFVLPAENATPLLKRKALHGAASASS